MRKTGNRGQASKYEHWQRQLIVKSACFEGGHIVWAQNLVVFWAFGACVSAVMGRSRSRSRTPKKHHKAKHHKHSRSRDRSESILSTHKRHKERSSERSDRLKEKPVKSRWVNACLDHGTKGKCSGVLLFFIMTANAQAQPQPDVKV